MSISDKARSAPARLARLSQRRLAVGQVALRR